LQWATFSVSEEELKKESLSTVVDRLLNERTLI
jgi:hypothetical protein